jgi:hypothetical protein
MMTKRKRILQSWLSRPNGRELLARIFSSRMAAGTGFKAICEDMELPWNLTRKALNLDAVILDDAYHPPPRYSHAKV